MTAISATQESKKELVINNNRYLGLHGNKLTNAYHLLETAALAPIVGHEYLCIHTGGLRSLRARRRGERVLQVSVERLLVNELACVDLFGLGALGGEERNALLQALPGRTYGSEATRRINP